MKRPVRLLALALVIAGVITGIAHAITFGEKDTDEIFPNVGGIVVLGRPGSGIPPRIWCSGTLIHPRVVLTAAHCTDPLEEIFDRVGHYRFVRVSFAVNALDNTTWHDVETVVSHPDFNHFQESGGPSGPGGASNPRDVGVIILAEPITDIEPAPLPSLGFLDDLVEQGLLENQGTDGGTRLEVAGYGTTLETPPPEIIPPDGCRRWAISEFKQLTKAWVILSQNPNIGNAGAGFGDSGGPTFWKDPDTGERTVIAVTSTGDANSISIDFHYRTDIAETLDFLDDVLDSLDD